MSSAANNSNHRRASAALFSASVNVSASFDRRARRIQFRNAVVILKAQAASIVASAARAKRWRGAVNGLRGIGMGLNQDATIITGEGCRWLIN